MINSFTGKRVRLRAPEPEDLMRMEAENPTHDTEQDRCEYKIDPPSAIWRMREEFPEKLKQESSEGFRRFMIETLEGETVGSVCAHGVDGRMGTFHYGIHVYAEQRGKGYASEAVLLLLRYYFMELRMHKCGTGVYAFNTASKALQEKLGFVLEGRQREVYYTKGRYHDALLYGMTKEEFEEKYKEFSQEG